MANVLGSWISDLVFDRRSREDSASAPVLDHGQMAAFGLSVGHEADGLVSKVARRRAEKPAAWYWIRQAVGLYPRRPGQPGHPDKTVHLAPLREIGRRAPVLIVGAVMRSSCRDGNTIGPPAELRAGDSGGG